MTSAERSLLGPAQAGVQPPDTARGAKAEPEPAGFFWAPLPLTQGSLAAGHWGPMSATYWERGG